MVTAFVHISTEPLAIDGVARSVAELPGVRDAYSVSGADADVIAIVRVPDVDDVRDLVTEHVAKLPGVTRTRTSLAYREYSSAEIGAAYEGFGD